MFIVGMPWHRKVRWVRSVVPTHKVLTNLRLQPIYSQTLINAMVRPWKERGNYGGLPKEDLGFLWPSREIAEQYLESVRRFSPGMVKDEQTEQASDE